MVDEFRTAHSNLNPRLSIVVPFYNSRDNSQRLLQTLAGLQHEWIELIFIDDGSVDGTYDMLLEFSEKCQLSLVVCRQHNGGPGKARNTGIRHARGDYIWFIDCDDDIDPVAIDEFDELYSQKYDFIDFDMLNVDPTNTMNVDGGEHIVDPQMRAHLISCYGALCTKIIRRDIFTGHNIWYPEYCIYEDNALSLFMPFLIRRFYKSERAGYIHLMDFESVTRQRVTPRYFDRLRTALWGFSVADKFASTPPHRAALEQRFIDLFLIKTTFQIFGMSHPNTGFIVSLKSGRLIEALSRLFMHVKSCWYARSWLQAARVHRHFRDSAGDLVQSHPLKRADSMGLKSRALLRAIWLTSFALPSQIGHFEKIRSRAWAEAPSEIFWLTPRT